MTVHVYTAGNDLSNIVLSSSDYPRQVGVENTTLDISATNKMQEHNRVTLLVSISKFAR